MIRELLSRARNQMASRCSVVKKALSLLLIAMTVASCSEKTPQELFDETKSGVVLILNEYYYVLKLPNGNSLYFTGIDSDGNLENLALEYSEIKDKKQMMSGTGFFIDEEGTIMTNRHVAQPQIDKSAVKDGYNNLVSSIKYIYAAQMRMIQQQYQELESQKNDCYGYDYYGNFSQNTEKLQEIESQQSELEQQYNELSEQMESLDDNVSLDELKITAVCKIGIAYNNTFVNSVQDFLGKNECVVVKVSSEESTDLALLQLKNKTTPENAYVFNTDGTVQESPIQELKHIFDSKKDKGLQIDQSLYMIGYNAGPTLAATRKGIQVQMTSGKVTQLPDGERVLYSIPTVQGSSGSPVIDSAGRLVAVNFAKFVGSDNFNFGIPLNKISAFAKR